jgi:hypothetical protein
MKGFKQVSAVSPVGVTTSIKGKALEIASEVPNQTHWTVHEKDHEQPRLLVGIIPKDWVLHTVPNDIA